MLGKKGQSALEYLMTYGWAILIIIIVGGVLYYYGVFSPSKLVGESKVGFNKVEIDSWAVDAANENVSFIFENRAGKKITITNTSVGGTWTNTSITMAEGGKSTIFESVDCPDIDAGDAYRWDVTIYYYIESFSGTTFKSSGTLSGTV